MKFVAAILAVILMAPMLIASDHLPTPRIQMVVLDETLQPAAALWQKEVGRRFDRAVVLMCHGGTFVRGEWLVKAQDGELPAMLASDLVKKYEADYPGVPVVLLACNPSHCKLNVKGCYYSASETWIIPDREVESHRDLQYLKMDGSEDAHQANRSDIDPDACGNIFEFVSD